MKYIIQIPSVLTIFLFLYKSVSGEFPSVRMEEFEMISSVPFLIFLQIISFLFNNHTSKMLDEIKKKYGGKGENEIEISTGSENVKKRISNKDIIIIKWNS